MASATVSRQSSESSVATLSRQSRDLASSRKSLVSVGGPERICAWFLKAPEKVGKARRRYFQLNKREILYFEDETKATKKGTIELLPTTAATAEGRELHIRNPQRTFLLTADDAAVCMQWQVAIMSRVLDREEVLATEATKGWLTKAADGFGQARRRYFVCEGSSVKYYDNEDLSAAKLKGQFQITQLTRITLNHETIQVDCPTRTWLLTADDTTSAARWASALLDAQAHAQENPDEPPSDGEDEAEGDRFVYPGQGVWMLKEGAKLSGALRGPQLRYFTPLIGNDLSEMKFAYFKRMVDGTPLDLRGYIPIRPNTLLEAADDVLTITNTDRVWTLFAEEAEDSSRWCEILTKCRATLVALSPMSTGSITASGDGDYQGHAQRSSSMVDDSGVSSLGTPKTITPQVLGEQSFELLDETSLNDNAPAAASATNTSVDGSKGVWLQKDAERVGQARRRFFVVEGNEARYFVDETCTALKGTIALSGAGVRQQGLAITIQTTERTWKLSASSDADAAVFVSQVMNAISGAPLATPTGCHSAVRLAADGPIHDARLGSDLMLCVTPAEDGGEHVRVPVLRTSLVLPAADRVTLINPTQVVELFAEPAVLVSWTSALRAARVAAAHLVIEEQPDVEPTEVALDQLTAPHMSAFTSWGGAGSMLDLRGSSLDVSRAIDETNEPSSGQPLGDEVPEARVSAAKPTRASAATASTKGPQGTPARSGGIKCCTIL